MTYVWKPDPPLPWCAICLDALTVEAGAYTCPLCPAEKPCPEPVDAPLPCSTWPTWLPSRETLLAMHGRREAA